MAARHTRFAFARAAGRGVDGGPMGYQWLALGEEDTMFLPQRLFKRAAQP